jgi:predicted nuclease of predicted toxin-antitoxin system
VRFLVDAQLPPALARWLRDAGHESEHVDDVGLLNARDHAIWQFVLQNQFVLLTKDEDFAVRSASTNDEPKPIVVWLRVGNTSNRALRSWIERRLPTILTLIEKNNQLIEVA